MKLDGLFVGKVALLDGGIKSAIAKKPVLERQELTFTGLKADEQANRRYHGGPEKAIHHYPFEHYALWRKDIGSKSVLESAGAFGENFSTCGLDEKAIAIGDVFRVGDAIVEVSQGRQPCEMLNIHFSVPDMALRVQTNGRTGWYYRVLEEGFVRAGDAMTLIERRAPEWTVHKIHHYFYIDPLNREALEKITTLTALSPSWRALAQKRLDTNRIEDWSKRLNGQNS